MRRLAVLLVALASLVAGCSLAADVTPPPAEEIAEVAVADTAEVESTVAVALQETQPATDGPTQTDTGTPTQTATAKTAVQQASCTADDPDEFGNIVNWCDDGSYWWIDSDTGTRYDTDASGNTTTTKTID